MVEDLSALVGAVADVAHVGGGVVIVAHPERETRIVLSTPRAPNFILLSSAAVAPDALIALAPVALAVADGDDPQIEVARQATLTMDDDPPAGGVLTAPTRSLLQTDSYGLKLALPVSWVLAAQSGAVATVTGISAW